MKNFSFLLLISFAFLSCGHNNTAHVKIFDICEIKLNANNQYRNPYVEVETWVVLKGPGFSKKIYGFWNGENEFVYRIAATKSGEWQWVSYSNQDDDGLNGKQGRLIASEWDELEKLANPNRRGFIKASDNGRALEYADGTSFFMLGDTWWAASTWRFPFTGQKPEDDYIPSEGITFENALEFRKNQGYNTIALIAAFPNWKTDAFPAQYMNNDSVGLRQAWEKNGQNTAKDMHDEKGNMPFYLMDGMGVLANFDSINPEFFKSLDKKMDYLNDQGFVAFLETIRRDHGPSWKKYFNWPESFSRYVQYIIARYGAYNIIFSGIHLDWIVEDYSLSADEFNEALTYHYNKYQGLPYGQPHTILIDGSTYTLFGHTDSAPWLNMHSVGNVPRNHGFYPMIEEIFNLSPAYPVANLEPYYPGWNNDFHNRVAGELPEPNSERDNYFGRTQMYGSVFSGALAGHIYGTGAYDGNTSGEPYEEGDRPYIWEGLNYISGSQLPYLSRFLLSEGKAYQNCSPQREKLKPNASKDSKVNGLDGWSFMLIADNNELAFLYFENEAEPPAISGLIPNKRYDLHWFDPINGQWLKNIESKKSNKNGVIKIEKLPTHKNILYNDLCLKLKMVK